MTEPFIWNTAINAITACQDRLYEDGLSVGEKAARVKFVEQCIDVLNQLAIDVTVDEPLEGYIDAFIEGVAEINRDDEDDDMSEIIVESFVFNSKRDHRNDRD